MHRVSHSPRAGAVDPCAASAEAIGTGLGSLLVCDSRADGDRTTVVVRGELDIDTVHELRRSLSTALTRSVRGVDLDLSGVVFCDCSGLNTLLALRREAHRRHKSVTVRSAGPAVHRILTLTGTLSLFDASDEAEAGDDGSVKRLPTTGSRPRDPDHVQVDGTEQELRTEVVQLRRAMRTRPTIDLARGILMAAFGLSADDAWSALVMTSQHTNAKLHRVAQGLVDTVSGTPLPESVQEVLADAVTKVGSARAR